MTREFRVAHASIELDGLGRSAGVDYYCSALEQSWIGGTQTTRYAHTWRLSNPRPLSATLWTGHMGYVLEDELLTLEWDDETNEFMRGSASKGVVVPLMIDAERHLLSFQLISNIVKPQTVVGNLQPLLNTKGTHRWIIRELVFPMSLDAWIQSVSRISGFSARIDYPNPSFKDRPNIEGLVNQLNAAYVNLRAKPHGVDSINIRSGWAREIFDHVVDGYGTIELTGPDTRFGRDSKIRITKTGGELPVIDKVESSEDALEVSDDQLRTTQLSLFAHRLKPTDADTLIESEDEDE